MKSEIAELKAFLENQGEAAEVVRSCLEALNDESPVLKSTEVPLKNVRKIYERRALLNEKQGGPVRGFERLIPNLKREIASTVRIHLIETSTHWFFVFTTPSMTRLIGILSSPKVSGANKEAFNIGE